MGWSALYGLVGNAANAAMQNPHVVRTPCAQCVYRASGHCAAPVITGWACEQGAALRVARLRGSTTGVKHRQVKSIRAFGSAGRLNPSVSSAPGHGRRVGQGFSVARVSAACSPSQASMRDHDSSTRALLTSSVLTSSCPRHHPAAGPPTDSGPTMSMAGKYVRYLRTSRVSNR
jgi:hypothetical protein